MRVWARPAVVVALLGVTSKAAEQPAVAGMETGRYLTPRIRTASTSGIAGHTTFTVSVTPATRSAQLDSAISIYAIFGDNNADAQLRLPPCYHVPAPFGVNIGGTNPAFWEVSPDAQYDSWLSVSETRGNVHNQISSIGITWEDWTETSGLDADDGAVFYMDPTSAPTFKDLGDDGAVIAQLTLPTGVTAHAVFNAQGKSTGGEKHDWEETNMHLTFFGKDAGSQAPAPEPAQMPPPGPPPPGPVAPITPRVDFSSPCTRDTLEHGTVHYRSSRGMQFRLASCDENFALRCLTTVGPHTQRTGACGGSSPATAYSQCSSATGDCTFAEGDQVCKGGEWVGSEGRSMYSCIRVPPPPPPPPSPPPAPPHSSECQATDLQTDFARIQEVCCVESHDDCSTGPPRHCVPHCAEVIQDFWGRCATLMSQLPSGFTAIDEFVTLCQTPSVGDTTHASDALNSLKDAAPSLQFSCTYTELTGIALQCSTTVAPTTAATRITFCASSCASQLIPFSQQCGSTMQTALTTFGLTDTFNSALVQCTANDDSHACPMAQITAACTSLSNPGGDAAALCATPCVQIVTAHYEACSASTDPTITSVFATDNWRPLVDLCHSMQDTSGVVDSEINAQCSLIESTMSQQLSDLCCRDSFCSTMPTDCSAECTDALIPYFRDCASQLMTDNPSLMARLTQLANACSASGH